MGRITVRVQPGAARRRVTGKVGEEWKLAVTAPPVDGKANAACIELLADVCGVPQSAVALVAGASARRKTFEVAGRASTQIDKALAARHAEAQG